MPVSSHRAIRTCHSHPKKFDGECIKGHCYDCGKDIPVCRAYSYVDPDNAAISNSAPILCANCYAKRYGSKPMTAEEAVKEEIACRLDDTAEHTGSCHDATLIHRIASFIREATS